MALNEAGARAATDQTSGEIPVVLISISSAELPEDMNFALNDADVTHNTIVFKRSGFQYKPPAQGDQVGTVGQLRIDNVDRVLSQAVKGLAEAPAIQIIQVLASDPDHIQDSFPPFKFFNISWNNFDMEGSIGLPNDSDEPSVSLSYSPREAPGLYAS